MEPTLSKSHGENPVRLLHFETLEPRCPKCRLEMIDVEPLTLAHIEIQQADHIIEGYLRCPNRYCGLEYPIVDGVPIIVNHIQQFINNHLYSITARNDFGLAIESLLGDATGPQNPYNIARHQVSCFAWDHYSDLAPAETLAASEGENEVRVFQPGGAVKCLNAGIGLLKKPPIPPIIDIGCSVGRTTFELAQNYQGLTLGIDINIWALRVAQRILRENQLIFPLRRVGLVFDRYAFEVNFAYQEQVDFWACDVLSLPFLDESFQMASALNVFDVVTAPRQLLTSIRNVLHEGGQAVIATPYDWLPPVPVENWVGGISQRGPDGGASEVRMRDMLMNHHAPKAVENLAIIGEIEHHPWYFRVHSRHTIAYDSHIIACEKKF